MVTIVQRHMDCQQADTHDCATVKMQKVGQR